MSPGRGILRVAPEVIREALHMPDTATIVSVRWDAYHRVVELLVESPDLPPETHVDVPVLSPTITHHAERFEWSWGIEGPNVERRS